MNSESSNHYLQYDKIKLITGGKAYFNELSKRINQAKRNIHLHSYILKNDQTGKKVIQQLVAAARRNVIVYLLLDKFGSMSLSKNTIKYIKSNGVKLKFFYQFNKSKGFYFSRRMHHKVMVIDDYFALVGGINIADRYNDIKEEEAWLDFAIAIEGNAIIALTNICEAFWYDLAFKNSYQYNRTKPIAKNENYYFRIRRNDWIWHTNEVSNTYIELFHTAQKEIIIISSYFLPGRAIRRLIKNTAQKGIRVKIITGKTSDVPLSKSAEKWLYDWILRNNIELYEYQKKVLHAKMAIRDLDFMTIGSYNINNLSTYVSIELNIDINNSEFVTTVSQQLKKLITEDCIKITPDNHKKNKYLLIQLKRWIAYRCIQMFFRIFTFYIKRNY